MKHFIAILLVTLLLMLCACGQDSASANDPVGSVSSTTTPTTTTTTEPTSSETQPTTQPTVHEDDTPKFSPDKLSVWGLAEPAFDYHCVGYEMSIRGMSADGVNPNLHPKFYYKASGDYATAYAYAEQVAGDGWGELLHEADDISPFAHSGTKGDYKVLIRWESDNTITIQVTDYTKLCQWDEGHDAYVVPDYGEYGTYGEYDSSLEGT